MNAPCPSALVRAEFELRGEMKGKICMLGAQVLEVQRKKHTRHRFFPSQLRKKENVGPLRKFPD